MCHPDILLHIQLLRRKKECHVVVYRFFPDVNAFCGSFIRFELHLDILGMSFFFDIIISMLAIQFHLVNTDPVEPDIG